MKNEKVEGNMWNNTRRGINTAMGDVVTVDDWDFFL
jgi:hypothetical protein